MCGGPVIVAVPSEAPGGLGAAPRTGSGCVTVVQVDGRTMGEVTVADGLPDGAVVLASEPLPGRRVYDPRDARSVGEAVAMHLAGVLPPVDAATVDLVVGPGRAVTLHYVLTDEDGRVLDASDGRPLRYVHGAGQVLPGLEAGLAGARAGEARRVELTAAQAYGERGPEHQVEVPRSSIPYPVSPGTPVQGAAADGRVLYVVNADEARLVLSTNHPLAGRGLCFAVTVQSVA